MKRLLGIDYGSKRIGIALTNESGDFALPFLVVENSKGAVDDIMKICEENNVGKIIVGESKDFSQKDNLIQKDINNFVDALRGKGMEVILHPEFLTSAQAEHVQGKNAMLDASAAAIILQSYIDTYGK